MELKADMAVQKTIQHASLTPGNLMVSMSLATFDGRSSMKGAYTLLAAVVLAGAGIGASARPAVANVLDFSGNICGGPCVNFGIIDSNYGSDANVTVSYQHNITGGPGPNLQWWDVYSTSLFGVAWGSDNNDTGIPEIFLNPVVSGQAITLKSLDFGAYLNETRTSQLTILDAVGNILRPSEAFVVGATPLHFDLNLVSTNGIRIQWGPSGYDVGIDNVTFDVAAAVPGPIVGAGLPGLLLAGAGLLWRWRRKRDRRILSQ